MGKNTRKRINAARARTRRVGPQAAAQGNCGVLVVSTTEGATLDVVKGSNGVQLDMDLDKGLELTASLFSALIPAAIERGISPTELSNRFMDLVEACTEAAARRAEEQPS